MSTTIVEAMEALPAQPQNQTRTQIIRAELKDWERVFASQNGGRKAERADIKQHPEIGKGTYCIVLAPIDVLQHKSTKSITGCEPETL